MIPKKYIIRQGYLTKSPPKEKIKNKMARWHMRWFVLFDNQELCEADNTVGREIKLYYFRNEEAFAKNEIPKGNLKQ